MERTDGFKEVIRAINRINYLAKLTGVRKDKIYQEYYALDGSRDGKIRHYQTYVKFSDALIGTEIRDFLNCYPLKKTYDGEKWGEKDYYDSKRYVDTLLSVTDKFRNHEEVTEFLYTVLLEEHLWSEIAVSLMMGASVYVEDKYGMDIFSAFLCYGQYEMQSKVTIPHYMKVVK